MSNLNNIGKLLAFILRHNPEAANVVADEYGWVDVEDLLKGITNEFYPLDMDTLIQVVEQDKKGRYAFNEDRTKIRAVQGHSFPVNLELKTLEPPKVLYHGTPRRNAEKIEISGLSRMQRQYVHLTENISTAYDVGARYHDQVVICVVDSGQMYKDGYDFYKSENNVWLTKSVPSKYLLQVALEDESETDKLEKYIKEIQNES